jgi:hypothetical protein
MAETTTTKGPIHLRYDGGQVVVTPEDHDRFVLASREATVACRNQLAIERFIDDFKGVVLAKLAAWCEEHCDRVSACYVPFPISGNCIKVFVVAKAAKFDFVLNDSIAELETELAESRWPCDVLQIATGGVEQLHVFFDPEQSIQVFGHGDGSRTPIEG